MRVFGCACKINFSKIIFKWPCVFKALTQKWFEVKIFTSNHFQTHAQRQRERKRERGRRESPVLRPSSSPTTTVVHSLDRAPVQQPQTEPIAPLRSQHRTSHHADRSKDRTASIAAPHTSLFLLLSIWPDLMNFFSGFCFFCVSVLRNDIIYLFGSWENVNNK